MNHDKLNYLNELRNCFKDKQEITYILGNSSSDMDSVVSSYILSVYKNMESNLMSLKDDEIIINKEINKIYLPVINCKRNTLLHRLDIKYLLKENKIDEKLLWYITDEEFTQENLKLASSSNKKINIILVDSSKFSSDQQYLCECVTGIYDHHKDLNVSNFKNIQEINIKCPLGSCTTLILLETYYNKKEIPTKLLSPSFCISAILMDTFNFKECFYLNRWIDLDKDVYEKILKDLPNFNKDEYYNCLESQKYDIDANLDLGLDVLLGKDYKEFTWNKNIKVIWSSLQVPFDAIEKRIGLNQIIETLKNFSHDKKIEDFKNFIYITLSFNSKRDGVLIKLFFFKDSITFDSKKLEDLIKDNFKERLLELKQENFEDNKIYNISCPMTISRKVGEPLLKKIFNELLN